MKMHRTYSYVSLVIAGALLGACKDRSEVKVYRVSKPDAQSPAPAVAAPQGPAMGGMPPMGGPSMTSGPTAPVTGNPPSNWEAQPLTSMRQASYLVKGSKGESADISLVALAGPAGGMLDNVNRWLSQLGQPAMTAEQLTQKAQKLKSPLGEVTVVDLAGLPAGADPAKDGRIIAGIVTSGEKSWFFKLRGNAALAESQKDGFIQWISTVRVGEAAPTHP
jgi:hypothetical protein